MSEKSCGCCNEDCPFRALILSNQEFLEKSLKTMTDDQPLLILALPKDQRIADILTEQSEKGTPSGMLACVLWLSDHYPDGLVTFSSVKAGVMTDFAERLSRQRRGKKHWPSEERIRGEQLLSYFVLGKVKELTRWMNSPNTLLARLAKALHLELTKNEVAVG